MHPVMYTPRDRPEVSRLYVLFKGTVKYAGKALGPGKIFGEQDVLLRGHFVIREQASCKTYVHANFIGQEDLYHLAADYPAAMRGMKANVMCTRTPPCGARHAWRASQCKACARTRRSTPHWS
jgi:hypothetical protein